MSQSQPAIERFYCPSCRAVFRTAFARCPLDGVHLDVCRADPLAGHDFADRYVIEECIGEGAMGRVYRARHRRVSRQFAIKVLFGDHAADAKMRSRFAREAEAAGRLSHENVISVIDFGETQEQLLYLVMDFVEGPTLTELLVKEAPFDRDRVIRLVRQLCKGLAHAHAKGLIHRDFKGENVIVARDSDGDEQCRIVDFGIAMMLEVRTSQSKLTTEGMVLGTPAVMSPEQATGDKCDLRTDLFALGVVLYEMLCGHLPFEGTPMQIARQNLVDRPPRITERVPGMVVDTSLEDLSHWLMSKKATDRPADARAVIQFLDELASVSGSRPSIARPASQSGQFTPHPAYPAEGRRSDPTPAPYGLTPTPVGALYPHASVEETERHAELAQTVMFESASVPALPRSRKPLLALALAGVAAAVVATVMLMGGQGKSNDQRATASGADAPSSPATPSPREPTEPVAVKAQVEPEEKAAVEPVEPEEKAAVEPVEPEEKAAVEPVEPEEKAAVEPEEKAAADPAAKARAEREKREKLEKLEKLRHDKAEREKAEREKAQLEKAQREKAQHEKAEREKAQAAAGGEDERTDVTSAEIQSLWKQVGELANKMPSTDPDAGEIQDAYFGLTSRRQAMMKTPADRISYWKSLLRLKRRISRKLK